VGEEGGGGRSRIHGSTISLRFVGITLRVLRLEISEWILIP
jgi:hypothetical protein